MSKQNWIKLNDVKVDEEIADHLTNHEQVIFRPRSAAERAPSIAEGRFSPDDYPWAGHVVLFCSKCQRRPSSRGRAVCVCGARFVAMASLGVPLHLFVYDHFNPGVRTNENVVHHINHDKLDARIKNLGLGTPRTHALAHNARRQKFTKKKKENLGGFRFRPPQPARVVDRPELLGVTAPIPPKAPVVPSSAQRMRELDDRLARLWQPLSVEMKGMDSGVPIPRGAPESAWRSPKTWKLGISIPRMELTPGEAAFVLLAVKHGWDFDWMSRESGEPEELLQLVMKSPAVDLATSRWRSHKRLPLAPM
jgi:hypothetical protein